jgi:hypothetical protein
VSRIGHLRGFIQGAKATVKGSHGIGFPDEGHLPVEKIVAVDTSQTTIKNVIGLILNMQGDVFP